MEVYMDFATQIEGFLSNLENVILEEKELINLNIPNYAYSDFQIDLRNDIYKLQNKINNDSNLLTQFKDLTIAKFEDRLILADIEKMIEFLVFYGQFNWSKEEIETIEDNLKFSKGELGSYEKLFYKDYKNIIEFDEDDTFKQAINNIFNELNKWQYLEIIEHFRTFAKMIEDDSDILKDLEYNIQECKDEKDCILKKILLEINKHSPYDIFTIKEDKMLYKPSIKESDDGTDNKKLHQDILLFNFIDGKIKLYYSEVTRSGDAAKEGAQFYVHTKTSIKHAKEVEEYFDLNKLKKDRFTLIENLRKIGLSNEKSYDIRTMLKDDIHNIELLKQDLEVFAQHSVIVSSAAVRKNEDSLKVLNKETGEKEYKIKDFDINKVFLYTWILAGLANAYTKGISFYKELSPEEHAKIKDIFTPIQENIHLYSINEKTHNITEINNPILLDDSYTEQFSLMLEEIKNKGVKAVIPNETIIENIKLASILIADGNKELYDKINEVKLTHSYIDSVFKDKALEDKDKVLELITNCKSFMKDIILSNDYLFEDYNNANDVENFKSLYNKIINLNNSKEEVFKLINNPDFLNYLYQIAPRLFLETMVDSDVKIADINEEATTQIVTIICKELVNNKNIMPDIKKKIIQKLKSEEPLSKEELFNILHDLKINKATTNTVDNITKIYEGAVKSNNITGKSSSKNIE